MIVGKETIRGTECDLDVNAKTGIWTVRHPDREAGGSLGYGDTKDKAVKQAAGKLAGKLAAAKVRVEVPFISLAGERGIATGVHAEHNGVLARLDGKAAVLTEYRQTFPLKADIPKDRLARFLELRKQARDAKREADAIERSYSFDLRAAVQGAVAEVQRAAQEASDR